jgi:hypothetical protein
MSNIFINICLPLIIFAALFFSAQPRAFAAEIAGNSARLSQLSVYQSSNNYVSNDFYFKAKAIEAILTEYQSPLVDQSQAFITACQRYEIDCYLLPAIAGLESTFGKFIYPNSYNPFGWGGGYIIFESWEKAIDTVASGLRNNYIDKGAKNVEMIGKIYSESPTWAIRIRWFINQFTKEEEEIRLLFNKNKVEL